MEIGAQDYDFCLRVVIFGKASRTDKEVAAMHGMGFLEYVMLRRGIEYKFYHYLKELID